MAPRNAPDKRFLPAAPLALALLALLPCLTYLAAALSHQGGVPALPLDDSWIHLAFAQNLAQGGGLSLNPGEPVAGSTGPLWTGLVSLALLLPGETILWMVAFGIASHLGVVVLVWVLVRALGAGRGIALVAGLATLLTGRLVWASLSGMEISLFTALSLAGIVLHLAERRFPARPPLSLAVLGVAVLARPEGLVLLTLALFDRLLDLRREPAGRLAWLPPRADALASLARGLLCAALAVLPVAFYYAWIGGSPIPTTLAAKSGGGGGIHLPELRYIGTALDIFLEANPWMLALAPAGAVTLVARLGGPRDRGLLPALWPFGLVLAYASMTAAGSAPLVGNFGRYLYPLLPPVTVLGALGLEPIAERLLGSPGRTSLRSALAVLGVAVLLWPTVTGLARTAGLYVRNVADIEAGDVRMARWLTERLPPEAVIATMDVGALSAILPNRIVDLAGIGDPEVHDFVARAEARGETWRSGVLELIAERRPDYLVIFPRWLPVPRGPGSGYRRLHTVQIPGNVTLGGDTLALYATPWNRHPLRRAPEEARVAPPADR